MSVEQICLKIKRGDSWSRTLCFEYHPSHALIDITGWTIFFTVKTSAEDPDSSAIISKTITSFANPLAGEAELELTSTDTSQAIGSYLFDLQVKTSNNEVYTVLEGLITITKDISQRTS
jgi:hypothetical protein